MTLDREILLGWEIVVCDDEVDNLEVATRILRFYKAKVHAALNGKEALALVKRVRPRVLLSDLSMPIMDGWELLYEVKQDPLLAHIPCIALTAHAMIGDRERAINAGFHSYITKPLSPLTFVPELIQALADVPSQPQPNQISESSQQSAPIIINPAVIVANHVVATDMIVKDSVIKDSIIKESENSL